MSEINNNDVEYYEGKQVALKNGYKIVYFTVGRCRKVSVPVHVLEACKKYNLEEIPEGYHVHHLDMNTLNNSQDNLILLSSEDHDILHQFLKKHPEYVGLSEEETKKWIEFARKFVDFKTGDKLKDAELELSRLKSKRRFAAKRGENDVVDETNKEIKIIRDELIAIREEEAKDRPPKPSKEELLEKLEEFQHMENLAKYYKRSSTAIRKWCKGYGIDFHQYSHTKLSKVLTRICPVCGKEFTCTEKEPKVYCSNECHKKRAFHDIDMEEAFDLYLNHGLSYRAIARSYGVSHQALIRNMDDYLPEYKKKHNIPDDDPVL